MKTRFFIYEAYKDEKAVLAHKQTPHYLACVDKLEELMSEPRKTQLCRIVAGVAVLLVALRLPGLRVRGC